MKKRLAALICAALMFVLSGCSNINLNFTGVSPFRNILDTGLTGEVDGAIHDYLVENGLSDISVGVITGIKAHFYSENMDEHTVVPIGKTTTMFVGMLIANFENNRWIDPYQNVNDWLKSGSAVPNYEGEEIKVWQLAMNLSGLGDVDTYGKDYYTAGMLHNQLEAGVMLQGKPGEVKRDSSLGYAVLTECLRQSYNMNANFVNLINNQAIVKMEMLNSSFKRTDTLAAYDGYQSTSYDLLKLVGHCIGSITYDRAQTNTVAGSLTEYWADGDQAMSLAFNIDKSGDNPIYSKGDNTPDGSAYVVFIPELQVGVSVTSKGDVDLENIALELLNIIK